MKLATIAAAGASHVGIVVDGDTAILDLQAADQALNGKVSSPFASMQGLIEAGPAGLEAVANLVAQATGRVAPIPLAEATLLAPLPEPVQMRDALCFEQHCLQAFAKARELRASRSPDPAAAMKDMEARGILSVPAEFYQIPIYYKQNRFSVAATHTDIIWPAYSEVMDYELEFAVIIGKRGIDIPRERALEHVFGYTIFNDLSARDTQFFEQAGGLGPAKGKDFKDGNVVGPWIVTADEIGDPYALEMVVRVNGEERGRGNSRSMHWRFEDVIARVSACEEIRAGEFIGSGTVGNGCGLEVSRFLEHGDVVELEVEKIGMLRNRVLRHAA